MTIKAIETEYNGYKFRSRLEARWAVFFDALGIEYEYEPEGYYGNNETKYLPDFRLSINETTLFAEVKGSDEQLDKDWYKIADAIDFDMTPVSNGLLILGEIPNYTEIGYGKIPIFNFLYCNQGITSDYAAFTSQKEKLVIGIDAISKHMVFSWNPYEKDYGDCFGNNPSNLTTKTMVFDVLSSMRTRGDARLVAAFKKARQARFEHGETPVVAHE